MVVKTLILGHSFISRFKSFIKVSKHRSVSMNLGLDKSREHVLLRGYPGVIWKKLKSVV